MKKLLLILTTISIIGCSQDDYKNVGDIPFNKELDNENFKICNESNIKQYYVRRSSDSPPTYLGEKRALENIIFSKYRFPQSANENGYITIRFIVNCNGETGRFRIEEMDLSYKSKKFDNNITDQLLEIVKNLKDWVPRKRNGKNLDFYQYLTFKMEKGQIVKILP